MTDQRRRDFFKKIGLGFLAIPFGKDSEYPRSFGKQAVKNVYFTTGFKISEVTDRSVTLWTRLCTQEKPNPVVHERREKVFRHPVDFDEDQPVAGMDGGVLAGSGEVRFRVYNTEEEQSSDWMEVKEVNDFTAKVTFSNLTPGTQYYVDITGRPDPAGRSVVERGSFRTAPEPDAVVPVLMTTSTCQYFWSFDDGKRGFRTYDSMRALHPDFFIQTGDYIYYDKPGPLAKNVEQARHKWHAMDAWHSLRDMYREVPMYMMKDDHDLLKDDVFPGMEPYGDLTYEQGLRVWYENAPVSGKPFRSVRWGKDLELWLMEGREYRSPNREEDGEEKSIWGERQKEWFRSTIEASDATFKLLISATPIVGPDRDTKKDNHANSVFATEGKWLRKYLSGQKNLFVVNGDRHWQYVSRDLETGLMEFGSGPVSDYHAQGWNADDVRPEHRFLRLKGGFLSISVHREKRQPVITFRHRDVNGVVVHEEQFRG